MSQMFVLAAYLKYGIISNRNVTPQWNCLTVSVSFSNSEEMLLTDVTRYSVVE